MTQRNVDCMRQLTAPCLSGISPTRFCCFEADPSSYEEPGRFVDAVREATKAAGWQDEPLIDAVMCIFVLSAVVPAREAAFVGSIASSVRPGGVLCLRDYAFGDMPMLRFARSARRSKDEPLFQRADATLARFYDKDELVERVKCAAAKVGVDLTCNSSQWCCVDVKNRAEQLDMRRVFVHAQFTRVT